MVPPRALPMLAGALILVAGCERAADPSADAGAAAGAVVADDAGRTGPGDAASTPALRSGEALPLPEDFPEDVYLPDRYAVTSVIAMHGTQVVSVTSRGKVSQLFDDARSAMEHAGWTQVMSMQHSADNAMLSFEKGGRATVFSFNRGEGADAVVIGVQLRDAERRDGS